MKKILLTLFAAASIFVACDKDNSLEPLVEIETAQDSYLDLSDVKDILNEIGFTGDLQNTPVPKGYVSSARTNGESTTTNCFDSRPDVPTGKTAFDIQYLPIDDSQGYLFLRGGGDIPLALNRPIVRFLIGSANEPIQLQLFLFNNGAFGQAIPLGPTPYNAGLTFIAADGVLSIDRTNLYLDTVTPNVTETAADAGVACSTAAPVAWESTQSNGITTFTHATYGSYTIQGAPCPLSGFLATMVTNDSGNSVRNYAGTSSSTVSDRIRDDFDGE